MLASKEARWLAHGWVTNWRNSVGMFAWQSACSVPGTWPFPYACSLLGSPSCVLRYLRSSRTAATQYRVLVTCWVSEFIAQDQLSSTQPVSSLPQAQSVSVSAHFTSLPLHVSARGCQPLNCVKVKYKMFGQFLIHFYEVPVSRFNQFAALCPFL